MGKNVFQRLKNMGPSAIVSAALIGPGTITTSGLSGCNFGFSLAWAVLFSVVVMVITQRTGAQMTAIALIGTTMTPYCIYLHSDSHASEKLEKPNTDVEDALIDNTYASVINALIMLCVSISIMVVGHALALNGGSISKVTDLANGLVPLAGAAAQSIFAIGIFAAGISSATCAPLAATYIICGVMGWSANLKDKRFRIIATFVFVVGCVFAIFGGTPTEIITTAQAIGGVALPISIILVILIANRKDILGKYVNRKTLNVLSIAVFVVTLVMSYRTFSTTLPTILGWFH